VPENNRVRNKIIRWATLAAAAVLSLSLSSCSPGQLTWYPLAQPGQVTQGFHPGHPGIDIWTPYGMPIHAVSAGTVTFAGWDAGYGNYTCITRDAGFRSCYAHQSVIFAHVGLRVTPGQTIGLVGQTGDASGPHLHFEIYRFGQAVDPLPYLPRR
jgi:murein DD-endopeptidase MepM/ murein hydrolase activator NlpD